MAKSSLAEDRFIDRLNAYEKAMERGESAPVEHEYLRNEIAQRFGIVAAQYFDKYGQASYITRTWLGWPVRYVHYNAFFLIQIGLTLWVAALVIYFGPRQFGLWVVLAAAVLGFLAWKYLLRFVMALPFIQPKNVSERFRRSAEYQALLAAEDDAVEAQAKSDRQNRLYGDNI